MDSSLENNDSQTHQAQHLLRSLWLHSPDLKDLKNLNKKQSDTNSINSSSHFSEHQSDRILKLSQKIVSDYKKNTETNENSSLSESIPKHSFLVNNSIGHNYKELNITFQKSDENCRNKEISVQKYEFEQEEDSLNQQKGILLATPLMRRQDSSRRFNGRPTNVQKELLSKFMQMYQKQKLHLTKLDVIVKLKTKLKSFFLNYTYLGRTYLLNQNHQIRKFIQDKSDVEVVSSQTNFYSSKKLRPINRNQSEIINSMSQMSQIALRQTNQQKIMLYLRKKINNISKRFQQIKVIKPHYEWVIALNITFIVLNYIYFYFLSMISTFDIPIDSRVIDLYDMLTFFLWIVEIIIKLNTATFYKGQFINSRKQLLKHYIQGSFIFDLIPIILIFFSNIESYSAILIRIVMSIKLVNNIRLKKEVEKILLMRIQHHYYIDIFNLVLNIYVVGHLIAIGFYNVVRLEINYLGYTNSFIDTLDEFQEFWWKRYLQSIEWAFTLMTTGSNTCQTTPEVVYLISIMMAVFVLFGYIINMIGFIILEIQQSNDEKNRDINIINNFMNRKHTSQELKHKVNLDLEYYYQRTVKKKSDIEQEVLGKISQELSDAISLEYNKKIISKIRFLNQNFSQQTIDKLCVKVEESFYSPNQTIFKEDQQQLNPPLIYIISGKAEILNQVEINLEKNDKKGGFQRKKFDYTFYNSMKTIVDRKPDDLNCQTFFQVIGELKKSQIFGEQSFITGSSNPYEIRSTDFTTVLKLERQTFIDILKQNEKDFQTFNEIKDKALFLSDFYHLGIKCKVCKSYKHEESQCPKCHFNKNNNIFYDKLNYSQQQDRQDHVRNIKCKFNALYDMLFILKDVEKIIDQIEVESVDEQLYQTLEANDFSQDNESHDLKLSIQSSSEEKYENTNNQGGVQRQPSVKLSIINGKFEQEKSNPQSQIDVIEKNQSYLSANIYSKQFDEEGNNNNNQANLNPRNNSLLVGTHLQPVNLNLKSQIDQQQKDYRDKEIVREKSLSSIKDRDLISQKSSIERRSKMQMVNQVNNNSILEELQKIQIQFQMMFNNRRNSYINSPFRISNNKFTNTDKKNVTLYDQNVFAEERSKQDQYWMFDQLKDYDFYFQEGNHTHVLQKFSNIRKKQLKEMNRAQSIVEKIGSKKNIK